MNRTTKWTRIKYFVMAAIAVGAAGMGINSIGCSNDNDADNGVTTVLAVDPFVYYVYIPGDVAVAGFYWTGDWTFANLYVPPAASVTTVADAVRALAAGQDVCGSSAVVTRSAVSCP